jgi:hypothetical protein
MTKAKPIEALFIKSLDEHPDEPEAHQQLFQYLSAYIWVEFVSADPVKNIERANLKSEAKFSYGNLAASVVNSQPTKPGSIVADYRLGKWAYVGDKHPLE